MSWVEDWFADGLGLSFRGLHQDAGLGVPIVRVECQFKSPCRIGDELTLFLTVLRLGDSSLQLQADGVVAGDLCITANMVLVFVDLKTYRAVGPPESLRERIEACVAPSPVEAN